jgi:hypothetical protein
MAVPYTFGSATTSIPLSQLDSNFATTITLGNTAIQLGNTVTTLNNMTLGNVTISSGTSNIQTNVANATGVLLEANGGTGTTTGYYGFKNRIINGAMVIDQRNAGASVTQAVQIDFPVDRFSIYGSVTSKFTAQQNAGSLSAANRPTGFTNYLGITSSSAYAVGASELFVVRELIEGFNVADFGWGTANASTATLSFWIRSSLTGTFGGAFRNSDGSRSYPFSYTISSANTWEQKTITVSGDTSGTWLTTNGVGLQVVWGLGCGSSVSGTAGTWSGSSFFSATGATSVVGTNGATFYITGVQLEKGSTATSFDYRPYGTELQLCQRYYWEASQTTYNTNTWATGAMATSNSIFTIRHPVEMRTSPSIGIAGNFTVYCGASNTTFSSISTSQAGTQSSRVLFGTVGTTGNSCWLDSNTGSTKLTFSAEL